MAGPLQGVRVIDLSTMISGPFATMLLGDQGADVIKVEAPGVGDYVRAGGNRSGGLHATFHNNNRNKRSITVDLKQQAGVEVVKRLAASGDVFIQNFRPGVVDRLGVGYDAIKAINPHIIYVSISGFGTEGPWAHKPVYDPIIQALSGLASIQGGSDQQRPRLIRTIVPDKLTAVTAAGAISSALYAREKTGKGQHISLSMIDAVLQFLWSSDMGAQTFVGKEVTQQRAASFIDLIYETKDGYMSVAVMSNAQWVALTDALEHPEWRDDERFKTPALRDLNINDRLELTQSVLVNKTTDDWMAILDGAGVPCAPVLTRSEVIKHPQILANGTLVEYDHAISGRLRQARHAAQFSETPADALGEAPVIAADTDEVLAESGFSDEEIANLREAQVVGQ
ncbi:MAG: CoA transferase [Alphaproteobacteria bacterium]|nr:MAG: CoA transferase [Alphaproteobacteria bacterium]